MRKPWCIVRHLHCECSSALTVDCWILFLNADIELNVDSDVHIKFRMLCGKNLQTSWNPYVAGYTYGTKYVKFIRKGITSDIWWQNDGGQINPQTFPDLANPQQMMPDTHVCSMRTVALMKTTAATLPWILLPVCWFTVRASVAYLYWPISRAGGKPFLNSNYFDAISEKSNIPSSANRQERCLWSVNEWQTLPKQQQVRPNRSSSFLTAARSPTINTTSSSIRLSVRLSILASALVDPQQPHRFTC